MLHYVQRHPVFHIPFHSSITHTHLFLHIHTHTLTCADNMKKESIRVSSVGRNILVPQLCSPLFMIHPLKPTSQNAHPETHFTALNALNAHYKTHITHNSTPPFTSTLQPIHCPFTILGVFGPGSSSNCFHSINNVIRRL